MIEPIILWVGGIIILLACVLFYLLIAELFKQQPKLVPQPTPRIRKPVTKSRFHNVGSQVIFTKTSSQGKTSALTSPTPQVSDVVSKENNPALTPSVTSTPLTSQVSNIVRTGIESKLLRLLHGDRAAALRLVESIKARNPDKSEQWSWEKAIFDLERDRC
jgi:hypothetical protein